MFQREMYDKAKISLEKTNTKPHKQAETAIEKTTTKEFKKTLANISSI